MFLKQTQKLMYVKRKKEKRKTTFCVFFEKYNIGVLDPEIVKWEARRGGLKHATKKTFKTLKTFQTHFYI